LRLHGPVDQRGPADGRPVRQGRAPLRPFREWRCACHAAVVPSAKDGLHCGLTWLEVNGEQVSKSSRPPRTGSIAAIFEPRCPRHAGLGRPVRQGRAPLRRCIPEVPGGTGRSRPVRQGRAPLRLVRRDRLPHLVAGRPVRQGRAPLRPREAEGAFLALALSSRPPRTGSIAAYTVAASSCRRRLVVPSAKDGLHCGLHRGGEQLPPPASRPVRQGRAPLRHVRCGLGVGMSMPVVPSAKDGLHCGIAAARELTPDEAASSRPPRTGSIAAFQVVSESPAASQSSRPPRTGSIAAGPAARQPS